MLRGYVIFSKVTESVDGALIKHPLAGFPSLFGDDDDEQQRMSQADAVPVEEDPALFAGDEPDPKSTPPSYVGVLSWPEYIAVVVCQLEPHFDAFADDANVLDLSTEMEVLCMQVPTADSDHIDDNDGSTISFSSPAKSQTFKELVESSQ
eukprot:1811299-Rhodomonas_salina.4